MTKTTTSQGGTVTRNSVFPTSTIGAAAPPKLERKQPGKIESGIPIPPRRREKYPFSEMQVGDSFWWRCSGSGVLMTAAHKFCEHHKKQWKFTARVEHDGDTKGARIWRTK